MRHAVKNEVQWAGNSDKGFRAIGVMEGQRSDGQKKAGVRILSRDSAKARSLQRRIQPPLAQSFLLGSVLLAISLTSCSNPLSQEQPPTSAPESASTPTATPGSQPATASPPSPSASVATKPATTARPALTLQKLKNAEYYILADGPVKLKNGKFQDAKKRSFTLGEVVAYGDLNKDGIKDAVTSVEIDISGRKFTYLVGVLNDQGTPKNVSSEFLGERVNVKTLSVNAGKIELVADVYAPGDAEGRPSLQIKRGFTYKPNTANSTGKSSPAAVAKPNSSPTPASGKPSSPAASPTN